MHFASRALLVASVVCVLVALEPFDACCAPQESLNMQAARDACANTPSAPRDIRQPSALPLADYEAILYRWLDGREYEKLGWAVDRGVRDTGPYLLGNYYGTHPAVRIHYSPEVIAWLLGGRQGTIADGAVIVKEMFPPPAARYTELEVELSTSPGTYEAALSASLMAWTVLIKDSKLDTHDGWFWAGPSPGYPVDGYGPPFTFPASTTASGACLRCHASAEAESTFVSLSNIKGFESHGDPLVFRVDDSWRTSLPPSLRPALGETGSELLASFLRQHVPDGLRTPVPNTSTALTRPSAAFLGTFDPIRLGADGKRVNLLPVSRNRVQSFPGQWADHVAPGAHASEPGRESEFITSDNCLGCHGGLGGEPSGVTMFVKTGAAYGDGYNISEFGEWRWSPMGLAGRDPIFYAQLESELAILRGELPPDSRGSQEAEQAVVNTCFSCHGGMGQRQLGFDHAMQPELDPNMYVEYAGLTTPLTAAEEEEQKARQIHGHSAYPYHKYGNLAREGISCMLCHRMEPPLTWQSGMDRNELLAEFLLNSTTGVYPVAQQNLLFGPFDDVKPRPMENSMGITPEQAPMVPGTETPYIQDSKMCGTCHTINLPNVDAPRDQPLEPLTAEEQRILNEAGERGAEFLKKEYGLSDGSWPDALTGFQHSIEQATYLEWENSDFAWSEDHQQSCQDCHMPGGFESLDGKVQIDQVTTQIATIQDSTYPASEESLPTKDITIPLRDDYRRHELVGLNVFLLEMFDQFDDILGIDESDYMTGAANGDELAIENMLRLAQQRTVALDLDVVDIEENQLTAEVRIQNLVGHRFPSGVGFRRAFLEVMAVEETSGGERILWASGRTNSVGVIVDGNGVPLKTEFLDQRVAGSEFALYQPHHEVIDSESEVQIYEELVANAKKEFTTSFIHRVHHPKDNRLLPRGYLDPRGPEFAERFASRGTGNLEKIRAFMLATSPEGIGEDDDFGAGGDRLTYVMSLPLDANLDNVSVRATMYYQAIPPYWLHQRFTTAPSGAATQRLYYMASHLQTAGTPIEDWKLPLVSATAPVMR